MTDHGNKDYDETQDGLFGINTQELLFHCAQVPPGESEEDLPLLHISENTKKHGKITKSKKKSGVDKRLRSQQSTFVLSRDKCSGKRLIQIKITDISGYDSENVIVSAQYIVKNNYDDVLDQTERIVKKICENITCN